MTYKRYWERNGTRRPFPPLYEAMKAYGDVMYKVPEYVNPKQGNVYIIEVKGNEHD